MSKALFLSAMSAMSAVVACLTAAATTLDASLIQTKGKPAVASGMFYGYCTATEGPGDTAFVQAKELAEREDVPLVVIWSHESCHYCDAFIADLNAKKSEVESWLGANRAVFAFFKATGYSDGEAAAGPLVTRPKASLDAWQFVNETCRSTPPWPLIGFYYRQSGGKSVVWRHGQKPNKDFAYLRDSFAAWCRKNGIGSSHGGTFTSVGTDGNRYEAEATTGFVDVTLVRSEIDAGFAGENRLEAVWPENRGETVETNVIWAVGQDRAVARLPLRLKDTAEFPVGEKITLNLYDAVSGEQTGTNFVFCVSPENASGNPLWIGERTVETLGWGEWTVDLDVATQKVASAEGSAYTVISLQGSKWCPDCANVERNFLDLTNEVGQNRFRLWAKAKNVALVSIDIPNFNGLTPDSYATPSLLDRTAYSTTLARAKEYPQSGADESLLTAQMRSGLGYLSRKMADDATARRWFERNWALAAHNTDAGGFHRPEDGNKNRTGVPIFVLLRKDGSVAARLTRMASVSPMASDRENFDAYLKRFEEMMALADAEVHGDATENENNHWTTTPLVVATDGGLVSNELCNADFQDVWRLDGAGVRTRQSVVVRGTSDANVTVSLLWVDAERTQRTLASLTGRLDEGLALTNDFTRAGEYFVQVAGANITNQEFALESPASAHFHGYQLETKSEQFPPETGEIAFVSPDVSVIEYAGTGVISVVRRNGSFGRTRVKVVCDNPPKDDRFEWNDTVLEWGEDEAGERQVFLPIVPNGSSDTNVTFVLRLEPDVPCVSEVSVGTCAVTVLDTDSPCLGQTSYVLQPNANFETAVPFDVYNVSNASTLAISVKKGSGTVPKGLRFVVDKTTGSVTLVGVPSEPGVYSFTVVLTEKRKNKTVTGLETVLTLTVADRSPENPRLAEARPRVTLPLYADGIVAGTLSFAVTSRGQLSARYTGTESRTISFAGNWQAFDEETGSAFAVLQTDDAVLSVEMDADGLAVLSLDLPPEASYFADGSGLTFEAASDWPEDLPFAAYRGRYNVTFPQAVVDGREMPLFEPSGTGFLQLDLSSGSSAEAGLVRYAGRLSDGTAVSGSARLIRDASSPNAALLPVFRKVSRSCFSATLEIGADGAAKWDKGDIEAKPGFLDREIVNAAPDTVALTLHRDDAWDYVTTNEVYGSYFIPGVDPAELSRLFYDGRWQFALQFKASQTPPSERHGEVRLVDSNANVAINTNAVWMISENDHVVFSYDPQTGIFSGGADLVFADGRTAFGEYCGALIPGWTTCGCGLENPPIRPFGSGTLRYRDWVNGRAVVRSFPVDVDVLSSADGSEPPVSPAVKVGEVAVEDDAGLSPSAPQEVIADADLTMLADRRIGDGLTADDVAVIGQYDAVTKCGVTAVSGLPTGLKLVKTTEGSITTYSVVGSFTAAKDFTVRVTVAAEDPGTGKIVKTTSSQKVSVGDADKIALTATVVDAESAPGCKVSGSGSYKRTAKATFKATAAKGYVFAGWYGADGMPLALDGADYRSASVSETVDELTVRDRYASFVPTADDGLVLDGLDGEAFGFDPCDGKTFRAVFDVQSLSLPTLTFKGLPTGVTCAPSGDFPSEYALVYDPATVRTAPKPGRYPVTATAKNATLKTAATAVTADFLITVANLTSEFIDVEDDYGILTPSVPMTPVSLSNAVDFAAGWTLAVSGLPAGLKYDDRKTPRMITGTPTKPGEYTLTFTAKQGRTTEIATAYMTVKPFPEIRAEIEDAAAREAGCKVTGTGNFKLGTKVTLRAVPARNWAFSGWTNATGTVLSQALNLTHVMESVDVTTVTATFVTETANLKSIRAKVNGIAFDAATVRAEATNITCGVRVEWPVSAWALAGTTVTVAGLPSGLKYKDGLISGAPTAVSRTDRDGKTVPSVVKITVKTTGTSKQVFELPVVVDPLPEWAYGTFSGEFYDHDGNLTGTISLTISSVGKVTSFKAIDAFGVTKTISLKNPQVDELLHRDNDGREYLISAEDYVVVVDVSGPDGGEGLGNRLRADWRAGETSFYGFANRNIWNMTIDGISVPQIPTAGLAAECDGISFLFKPKGAVVVKSGSANGSARFELLSHQDATGTWSGEMTVSLPKAGILREFLVVMKDDGTSVDLKEGK